MSNAHLIFLDKEMVALGSRCQHYNESGSVLRFISYLNVACKINIGNVELLLLSLPKKLTQASDVFDKLLSMFGYANKPWISIETYS
ncbi:hypothetical protein C8N25_10711 [Algoriphagus antarcticus]|uniref:Uncharacterized protein n=1 Tax=Algoriphagus antarcticus TaxID=238540 RepID=A0A3E0DW22_9BACT|nr:hypothetical protein C8N25_10711 [Algoriphagus antarcticus]